ncbi:MAG: C40 family peptidase [Fimbriimonadaceae bacterium]|nr:MAG: C40 family peptidase [Fimbriimonadaceae bacterium]
MRIGLLSLLVFLCALCFGQTAGASGGKVIGKLGQAVDVAAIHASASPKGKIYYRTKKFQYLIVNATKHEGWLSVVLQNGRSGFIEADKVARLPYDVRINQPVSRGNTTSRGGVAVRANDPEKQQMLQYSFNYIGTPYVWGGNSLNNGVDCSGFVQQLFGKIGVDLPRTAAEQALVGKPVERLEDLLPGDRLYFWESKRGKIGHTGIFLGFQGDGRAYFIHSSSGRKGVQTDDLAKPSWRKILVAARRD